VLFIYEIMSSFGYEFNILFNHIMKSSFFFLRSFSKNLSFIFSLESWMFCHLPPFLSCPYFHFLLVFNISFLVLINPVYCYINFCLFIILVIFFDNSNLKRELSMICTHNYKPINWVLIIKLFMNLSYYLPTRLVYWIRNHMLHYTLTESVAVDV